jgi:hypothetical protein
MDIAAGQSQDSHHATLIVATLVVVLFSVMVLGALTKPLLDFMLPPGDSLAISLKCHCLCIVNTCLMVAFF